MKPRTTLTLVAIGGCFFAYIWFVEKHQKTTRELEDSNAKVVEIEQDKITSIALKSGDAQVELVKNDASWRLQAPLQDRADTPTVNSLLSLVSGLRHDSKILLEKAQEKEKLKEFGVDASDTQIRLKSDKGKEITLLIGKDSAVDGKVYVRVDGSEAVYVIRNELRNQVTKKADDFRDKKLSDTAPALVQKIHVKTAELEVELERKNNHWSFLKPIAARAADQKVNDLLASVLNAQVSQFLPETPTPEQGLAEPRATVQLTLDGQKDPLTLTVGAAPTGDENKEKSFAKLSTRAAVTVLANTALDPLIKPRIADLRDRKLLRVESDIVDRLTIESQAGSKFVLARKGESWVRKEGDKEIAINDAMASRLLTELVAAEATNLVADAAESPEELEKYGLGKPQVKVTLSSYASENTAETKAGEKPLASLLFGTVEGDNGYTKLEQEPFILAAPKTLISGIPTHPVQIQPLLLTEVKSDEVTKLTVKTGETAVSVEKKENEWKLSGGEGTVNTPAVQGVLGILANLRAQKWIGPTDAAAQGLEKPELTVTVEMKKGDQTSSIEIKLGSATEENSLYATLSGKEGTCTISRADRDALGAKLLQ
jgi:hypothetical protein